MSAEVTIWCDECKASCATGPTVASARAVLASQRGMVNMPGPGGSEDVCAKCAKAIREKPWLRQQAERRWGRAVPGVRVAHVGSPA